MRPLHLGWAALAAWSMLAGCATTGPTGSEDADSRRATLYRAHAGEPVDGFFGPVSDWTSLDDQSLAVWVGPNRGYLLEVLGPCQELPWAQRITFDTGFASRISRFDSVIVLGRGPQTMPCKIHDIRPLDAKALKQAQQVTRDAG
jgi:hypothetical protein